MLLVMCASPQLHCLEQADQDSQTQPCQVAAQNGMCTVSCKHASPAKPVPSRTPQRFKHQHTRHTRHTQGIQPCITCLPRTHTPCACLQRTLQAPQKRASNRIAAPIPLLPNRSWSPVLQQYMGSQQTATATAKLEFQHTCFAGTHQRPEAASLSARGRGSGSCPLFTSSIPGCVADTSPCCTTSTHTQNTYQSHRAFGFIGLRTSVKKPPADAMVCCRHQCTTTSPISSCQISQWPTPAAM
ncbi:hypothetical protein COO60DRAFT_1218707 [Scenedesmus sp. NREL 46B-D3]|nr:hypothetical protein COO60DRAFT_1218707 [Scenedesmus sp. NREL 46B-D3]